MNNNLAVKVVHPDRLADGGDIRKSYSADLIAMGKPIRKPFEHEGKLFCAVSGGNGYRTAYELVVEDDFDGVVVTSYMGRSFGYHGSRVTTDEDQVFVLKGPEIMFIPKEETK